MTGAVLYLRVSTAAQVEGFGLDAQERAGRAYAKAHGLHIREVFRDEGLSGRLTAQERPGLLAALDILATPEVDALIVARLDRIARSLTVQEAVLWQVWKHDRAVHAADTGPVLRDDPDDPMRTAMRQMTGVFAELDRNMIVKRMRDGRAAKAARGGRAVGRPPYGYRAVSGGLEPVPEQQAALALMRDLAAAGQPHRVIAARLAAAGHPTQRGGHWSPPVVSRILSRPPVPPEQIAASAPGTTPMTT